MNKNFDLKKEIDEKPLFVPFMGLEKAYEREEKMNFIKDLHKFTGITKVLAVCIYITIDIL